jgi:4-nitrophenyl phosphatase
MTAIRGAIVDVDGTVLRGDAICPGAREGLAALREAGVETLFCSNNPSKRPPAYVERFADQDVAVDADRVLTSATVTAAYLAREHPDAAHFVVGSAALRETLRDRGLDLADDPDAVNVVVGSWDDGFDYGDLQRSLWALTEADAFYGTDPDRVVPTEDRPMPGSGAIVRSMAGVADRDPDAVLGKPHAFTRRLALDRLGTDPAETLVVGDRLDTDVALAADGMTSALVLTGIADRGDVRAAPADGRPDHVLDTLADVADLV